MATKRKQETVGPATQESAGAAAAPAKKPAASGENKPKARRAAVTKKPVESAATADLMSLQEEIARRAYSYWESRGGEGGTSEEDWYRAEQEVLGRHGKAKSG